MCMVVFHGVEPYFEAQKAADYEEWYNSQPDCEEYDAKIDNDPSWS